MGRFDGKVAIVTGGGQAMGEQFVLRLAQEGAHVMIADIIPEKGEAVVAKIAAMGLPRAAYFRTDVSDEDLIKTMVEKALEFTGKIDFLVNNSGIMGPVKPLDEVSREEWEYTFAVNMTGLFMCTKYVLPHMKAQKKGSIVNISSISGKRPMVLRGTYCASKAAVIGFTRTLAEEVGPFGIRANTVCPGAVTGDRQKLVFEGLAKATGMPVEEVAQSRKNQLPLRELIDPSEVAAVVAFLLSDEASKMTGQDINVTAGAIMY
ncbi:SDR family oxidoreductase [Desulfovibrio sp. OttesenSCG-928-O18]|nr:SDR family oxidoreductase [Desulfovibrio sp. OttesenSCG-928-O18]